MLAPRTDRLFLKFCLRLGSPEMVPEMSIPVKWLTEFLAQEKPVGEWGRRTGKEARPGAVSSKSAGQ